MAAPLREDIKLYLGNNGVPTNNTDPILGNINTSVEVDENTLGNLFGPLRVSGTTVEYFGGGYFRSEHDSPGLWDNARMANRAGARVNTTASAANVSSSNPLDVGDILITGKVGGNWQQETLTLTGTTPVVGTVVWDNGSVIRWEYLSGTPLGNITCGVGSYVCGILWGTNDDPPDAGPSIAVRMISAEFALALASSKNANITSTNRLTAPASGIGSFSQAVKWNGNDQSINVPTLELEADDYIGFVVRFTAYAGVPSPSNGKLQFKISLHGDSLSS